MSQLETKYTFCRICEASCGLVADVQDDKVVSIAPNRDHHGTLGFSCMKGLHQHRMYDSPDRLRYPLKRVGDTFERISWGQALAEIGAKVRQLRGVSPHSIGMYVGTAAGFSILHPIFAEGFMQGIGSRNTFSSSTQDCANRFAAATEMYGFPFFQPFVDLDNVECMLVVGTNPVVSKWTFLQVAHPIKRMKEVKARGGRIIVIDPRHTETAKVAGEHVFIRPNADVFFFLAFLQEIFATGRCDEARIRPHSSGLDELRAAVADWTPEKTAAATGIPAAQLRQLVATFCDANGAAIVTGTGLGMGQDGTLAQWLAECIIAVTGNLDRRGGTLVGAGIFDFAGYAKKAGMFTRKARSRIGNFRELNGGFPGAILADEILTPGRDQIKSLFVTGGNPLMTMANSGRLRDALAQLELLVVTDIYLNETASLAHYVLPATSPLQRPDLPFVFPLFLGMQSIPYLAATDSVVEPEGEQRDEASIYTDLATASGVNLFGSKAVQWFLRGLKLANRLRHPRAQPGLPQRFILDQMLRRSGHGSFRELLRHPGGKPRDQVAPGTFLGKRPTTDDGLVHLAPPEFIAGTGLLGERFTALTSGEGDGVFRLISKRAHSTHNSWTQNIDELTNGEHNQTNHVYVHPADAAKLGLAEGDVADIESATGAIRLPVRLLEELMPGTVSVPHGWGHQHARGLGVASRLAGANVNLLASDGPDSVEQLSGMSHLSGIAVTVRAAAGPVNRQSWSGC
ncbi:MAG: molybdopterin-dependent oxidoreductase [Gammaproteobacteria bacterium]|nr:molybdopterin-dependent oxidoreductase [Gammaproteobacteria bacterium]